MADADNLYYQIESMVKEVNEKITHGMKSRAYRVSNELRNASQDVLRGQRSGREYIVPGTGRVHYKKGKRVVIGREADNYGRKGRKIYGREAGTATITYKRYRASAPGEPPAVRTGTFREKWQTKTESTGSGDSLSVRAMIENDVRTDNGKYLLGPLLEDGTGKMAPRPYKEKIQQKALPKAVRIYREPYFS